MKFLVLALCVCAASAASFGNARPWAQASASVNSGFGGRFAQPTVQVYKPATVAAVAPVAEVAPVVAATPFVAAEAPVVAAKAVYNAGSNVYSQAKTTVYNAGAETYNKGKNYNSEVDSAIVRSESEVQPDGFNYVYETANGISAEASGALKKVGDAESVVVQGSYRYTSPDGTPVVVNYIADENGYQPQSDLLPVGPAIPEAILRSLQYIAAHPQQQEQFAKKF